MAESDAAWAAGSRRSSSVRPEAERATRAELRELAGRRSIDAQPAPAAPSASTRRRCRRWPTRSRSAACCSPSSSARGRAARTSCRRRAPLARRPARGPRELPALVRSATTPQSLEVALIENMAREDLNPVEAGARLRRARRGARPHAGGGRPPRRPQPRRRLEPDAPARPARRGARPARVRRADRGPRPRAAAGRRTMPTAAAWPARRSRAAGRSASSSSAPAPANAPARAPASAAARGPSRPGRPRCARISEALGGALGTDVRVRPRGTGYKVEFAFDDADEALALARRLRPRRSPEASLSIAPAWAISSVG